MEPPQNKTWDLSLYELNRQPQEAITDNSEIAVSPRSLHSELMCPICLDMLKKTMTTKECLHRFCSDCIITALRSGNKECPTCRKKLVSKRSLRPDPNFDCLISKIYPSREEYEAHQERVLAKFNQSHSQVSLVNSHTVNELMKLQSQNRPQRSRKNHENEGRGAENNNSSNPMGNEANVSRESSSGANVGDRQSSNPPSVRSTPSPAPSNNSSGTGKVKSARSAMSWERSEESESNSEIDYSRTDGNDSNVDTEGEGNSELGLNDEIELVFKPHPTEMTSDNPLMRALKENCVRYLKTTANATGMRFFEETKTLKHLNFLFTVDHLGKYLAMRLTLDLGTELPEGGLVNFCIYISPSPPQLLVLNGNQTLQQVNEKIWRVGHGDGCH